MAGYEGLIPSLTNDEKDRHVLAAAVHVQARRIITFNLKHFPERALAPYGITAQGPDEFLLAIAGPTPETMTRIIREQATALERPPRPRVSSTRSPNMPPPLSRSSVPMLKAEPERICPLLLSTLTVPYTLAGLARAGKVGRRKERDRCRRAFRILWMEPTRAITRSRIMPGAHRPTERYRSGPARSAMANPA